MHCRGASAQSVSGIAEVGMYICTYIRYIPTYL